MNLCYRICFAGRKKKSIFYVLFCFAVGNLDRNEVIVWGKKEKHNKKPHTSPQVFLLKYGYLAIFILILVMMFFNLHIFLLRENTDF